MRTAYDRGVLVEPGAWHWAGDPPAPSIVLGYGSATEPAVRRGLQVIAGVIGER